MHQLRWRCATTPYYGPGRSGVHPEIEEGRYSRSVSAENAGIGTEERSLSLLLVGRDCRPSCNPSDQP